MTPAVPGAAAARFLRRAPSMLVGGRWVAAASGETLATLDPATGAELARVPAGGAEDVDAAVAAARHAFEEGPWSRLSPSQRCRLLCRLADLVEENPDELAELETLDCGTVVGGGRRGERGWFVEPTVYTGVDDSTALVREEIFGPVLVASPFDGLDEVAARANRSVYGLAAGVWTRDLSTAHRLAAALRVGTVWINGYAASDVALPYGGVRQSGWGREKGREGVEVYTETKTVVVTL